MVSRRVRSEQNFVFGKETTRLWKGKVALITGSSRGIGAATAELYAAHGAKVVVNYVSRRDAALEVVSRIEAAGGTAIAVGADSRDQAAVKAMVAEAEAKLGPIDILVVNANMHFKMAPFINFTWEEFAAKYDGELQSAFFPCQAVVPSMIARKTGCILMVSSGLSKHPGDGFIAHCTAKSALNAFSRSLAYELGPQGIRVATIAPGLTLTDATSWLPEEQKHFMGSLAALKRVALPEDLAGSLLLMASDYARFVTGVYLPVDGGVTMN